MSTNKQVQSNNPSPQAFPSPPPSWADIPIEKPACFENTKFSHKNKEKKRTYKNKRRTNNGSDIFTNMGTFGQPEAVNNNFNFDFNNEFQNYEDQVQDVFTNMGTWHNGMVYYPPPPPPSIPSPPASVVIFGTPHYYPEEHINQGCEYYPDGSYGPSPSGTGSPFQNIELHPDYVDGYFDSNFVYRPYPKQPSAN
ncbi:unnamed protein product [Caenorhabditis bovis]|uniref:Uncharacterized protein n=1 Tax=Caenorhabditis bovis TaxID=2654633 RepID=A0A8S1EWK6_9PELO|nr:unnamed protein product [Caenorhabditis bovis]